MKTHLTLAILFALIGFVAADYIALQHAKKHGVAKYGGLFTNTKGSVLVK